MPKFAGIARKPKPVLTPRCARLSRTRCSRKIATAMTAAITKLWRAIPRSLPPRGPGGAGSGLASAAVSCISEPVRLVQPVPERPAYLPTAHGFPPTAPGLNLRNAFPGYENRGRGEREMTAAARAGRKTIDAGHLPPPTTLIV